jgi:hypothetical protein
MASLQDRIEGGFPFLFPFRRPQYLIYPVKVLPGPANHDFGGTPVEILWLEGKNLRPPETGKEHGRTDRQFQSACENPRPEKPEHFIFRQSIPDLAINRWWIDILKRVKLFMVFF